MAKPNPSVQKRLRERKKREQREEKAQRRAARQADKEPRGDTSLGFEVIDPAEMLGIPREDEEQPSDDSGDDRSES